MPKFRTFAITAAVAALVAAGAAPAQGATKPKPTCKRSNSTTVAQNSAVRVFTRPDRDGYAQGTDLLACWRRTGRVRELAYAFDDDYVSSAQFALVRLRGGFVAFYTQTFDISCKAACPPDWEATRRHLNVVDVRRGTGHDVRVAERPARLLLDGRGAIAWPRPLTAGAVEVRVVDGAGERAVDSGAIAPRSLALTAGGRLSWLRDGVARSTLLQPFAR
jgi:hypothetical protein